MNKIIITAALTGGIHAKEVNPALPEQPDEIIKDAYDCYNAGAAIVHLHARDEHGKGVGDPRIFSEINRGIRERCPVVVQNTTGGPGIPIKERLTVLDAARDGIVEHGFDSVFRRQGEKGGHVFQSAFGNRGILHGNAASWR